MVWQETTCLVCTRPWFLSPTVKKPSLLKIILVIPQLFFLLPHAQSLSQVLTFIITQSSFTCVVIYSFLIFRERERDLESRCLCEGQQTTELVLLFHLAGARAQTQAAMLNKLLSLPGCSIGSTCCSGFVRGCFFLCTCMEKLISLPL